MNRTKLPGGCYRSAANVISVRSDQLRRQGIHHPPTATERLDRPAATVQVNRTGQADHRWIARSIVVAVGRSAFRGRAGVERGLPPDDATVVLGDRIGGFGR